MQVPDSLHAAFRAAALVTQMTVLTALGGFGGWMLDGWLASTPVLALILGGTGFASGLLLVWRAFSAATDDDSPDS